MNKNTHDVAYLHGRLTHSSMTENIIKTLAVSLQKLELLGDKILRIDCRKVKSADFSGLQLLYVWMQCARFRGIEPELVHLSGALQQCLVTLGIGRDFIGKPPLAEAV